MKFRDSENEKRRWSPAEWLLYYFALTGIAACLIALAINLLR